MAHVWARWLLNSCRLGDPHRFRAAGRIRSGPPCGQGGYLTLAASGIPSASERGAESEMAHLWARWLLNSCRLGDPHRFRAGGRIRSGPPCGQGGYLTPTASGIPSASERGAQSQMANRWARWLLNPCRLGDPLSFRAAGRIRSGPPCGQGGYLTPAASGIPSASERGAESEMANMWARWLLNSCRLGDPLRFR